MDPPMPDGYDNYEREERLPKWAQTIDRYDRASSAWEVAPLFVN